jgi:hypothetical protein
MKAWWRSKVIWFNLFAGSFATLEATFHFLRPMFGDMLYGVGAVIIAMVNMVLRVTTNQQIVFGKKPDEGGQQ